MKHTVVVPGVLAVLDEVIPDPQTYRRAACASAFGAVEAGPDTFLGIAPCADPTLPDLLMRILPAGALPTVSFFRRSPHRQVEPHYLHHDAMMADLTAILYLNPDPPVGDGTTFWRTVDTQQDRGADIETSSLRDLSLWERWHHVDAKFNRLLIFKSDLFHSRAIAENYGAGDEARLIQVVFLQGALLA